MGWSLIGEVFGRLTALIIPHGSMSDETLGHIGAALLGGFASLGIFRKFKTVDANEFNRQLIDIDIQFRKNLITDDERDKLRDACMKGYSKRLSK